MFDLLAAIAGCKPRGTVVIQGVVRLTKRLVIAKPITLSGGTITGSAPGAILELRAAVTLSNVKITRTRGIGHVIELLRGTLIGSKLVVKGGRTKKGAGGAGIRFAGSSAGTLASCVFERNYDGVLVEGSARVDLQRCTSRANANTGVAYQGRSSGTITGCETSGSLAGMFFGEQTTAVARDCSCDRARIAGLMFRQQTTARAEKCTVTHSAQQGVCTDNRAAPTLIGCRVDGSKYHGIWWTERAGGMIERCELANNKINGMCADGSTSVVIRDVHFHHNKAQGLLLGGKTTARVERCVSEHNNVAGFNAWETARPTIVGSRARANKDAGFLVTGRAKAHIERCTASGNAYDGVMVMEDSDATLVAVEATRNAGSGIATYGDCAATIRDCTTTANEDDGISLANDSSARLEVVGNRSSNNASDDFYVCDDVTELVLENNRFSKTRGLYYVTRNATKVPPLLARFADFVGSLRFGSIGFFELCLEKFDPMGYTEHAALLGKALQFLTLPEGSELALLDVPEPRPVVLIGSEGELSTVANSLAEFLHRLAAGKTKIMELDEKAATGRGALRSWLAANKVKRPQAAKLFDFTAYLAAGKTPPPSDAARAKALAKLLPKLEALASSDRELAKSLGRPAPARAMAALATAFGGAIPADVATWFAWHDGQKSFTGLHPDENWTLITATEALGTWGMLNEPGADLLPPPRDTLVPLFDNGGGDNLMYEHAGPSRGALYVHYHDDPDAPKHPQYASLAAWVEHAIEGRRVDSAAKRVASDLDFDVRFTKVRPPKSVLELSSAPIGSTYYRSEYLTLYDGPAIHMFAKITDTAWAEGWGRKVTDAVEEIQRTVDKEPEKAWSNAAKYVLWAITSHSSLDKLSPRTVPPGLFHGVARG